MYGPRHDMHSADTPDSAVRKLQPSANVDRKGLFLLPHVERVSKEESPANQIEFRRQAEIHCIWANVGSHVEDYEA